MRKMGSTKLNSKTEMQTFSETHLGRRLGGCAQIRVLMGRWVEINVEKKKNFLLIYFVPRHGLGGGPSQLRRFR